MARLGTKPPILAVSALETVVVLDRLSKSALIDLYLAALARVLGAGDTPPTLEEVREDANRVLDLRGDRRIG